MGSKQAEGGRPFSTKEVGWKLHQARQIEVHRKLKDWAFKLRAYKVGSGKGNLPNVL